ncbi:MAG: DUF3089 domain-containing protein [Polymorphobacter sp.]
MLARRFLWIIAILTMLVIAAAFAYRLFGDRLIRIAMVPSADYVAPPASDAPDYALARNWIARPDLPTDVARWTPAGYSAAPQPGIAVFYVLPTSVFDRSRWNASIADVDVAKRMELFLRSQASIFNGVGAVWSPRYRQATFGAFLTDKPEAKQALDLAYGDVLAAFDAFLAAQPAGRPIILAGHSQGSLHLLRLLKERVAGKPLAQRIVAVYAAGWPISVSADLPVLGLPACAAPDQTGCILSWQSFARPADYKMVREAFDKDNGLTGLPRKGSAILCTNPLTGTTGATAVPAGANLGSLVPNADFTSGTLVAKGIAAQCLASGIVDIGEPPAGFTAYVLPGNNYHVYDYPLFWADLRADAERRVGNFGAPPPAKPAA